MKQRKANEDEIRRFVEERHVVKENLATHKPSMPEGSSWFYLGKAGEIGFTISVPIVAGTLIGAYLDSRWSTYPKATLMGIFGGLFLSVVNFVRLIIEIIKTS